MASRFYSRTHRERPFYNFRQLADTEAVKWNDIIWANNTLQMGVCTYNFDSLLTGPAKFMRMARTSWPGAWVNKIEAGITPPELIEALEVAFAPFISDRSGIIIKRTYSLWRPKLVVERREWQGTELPLP